MTKADNIVLTGNTFRLGRDDGGVGTWSPDYCMVIKDCNHCIVRDNVWHRASIEDGIVLLGDNPEVEVDHNIGSTHKPEN